MSMLRRTYESGVVVVVNVTDEDSTEEDGEDDAEEPSARTRFILARIRSCSEERLIMLKGERRERGDARTR